MLVNICCETIPLFHDQEAVPAGATLCGDALLAQSISATIGRLIDGDETAAVLKCDPGEFMVRPL